MTAGLILPGQSVDRGQVTHRNLAVLFALDECRFCFRSRVLLDNSESVIICLSTLL